MNKSMVSKETKSKAAAAITDKGIPFKIGEHEFFIGKLVLGTIIQISELAESLHEMTNKTINGDIVRSMAKDARIKARIVAIAIIGSRQSDEKPKRKLFSFKKERVNQNLMNEGELTDYILNKLDATELKLLLDLINGRMGVEPFFQSTVLLKGINILETTSKTVSDQHTQYGEE